jgi:hypothetical protein
MLLRICEVAGDRADPDRRRRLMTFAAMAPKRLGP